MEKTDVDMNCRDRSINCVFNGVIVFNEMKVYKYKVLRLIIFKRGNRILDAISDSTITHS